VNISFTESTVEEAALEWFGELGYAIGHEPEMASEEAAAERERDGASNGERPTSNGEAKMEPHESAFQIHPEEWSG
jgi:hypothetical protein